MVTTNNYRLKTAHFWDMLSNLAEIQHYFGRTSATIFRSSPDMLVNF